ncbi:MAG: tRNA pseudouridine(38-40) synthase TruA [Chloroflexi bacterium RBG_16_50_11]|nr:MAG: tRNA pseudouridine(38-40) synthase TruA [Chloroflexi bacterium RBG_16_50_11]
MAADLATSTRIILIIEYDGTNYHGSQSQVNAPTVQGEIEKALKNLTGERIRIKIASRTDAGVHARGQVISLDTGKKIPLKSFIDGLNYHLPQDIAVREAFKAEPDFDVRRRAVSREYRYYILNSPTRSPIRQGFSWRVAGKLDIAAMQQACKALIGRHDFTSFVSSEAVARQKRTVRDIFKAEITKDGEMVVFYITANSFLPHQVRNMIGSLIKVGQDKMTADEFNKMVESRTPGLAGPTAPAEGLCLVQVNYPGPFKGEAR